jgi:hypothetical protein
MTPAREKVACRLTIPCEEEREKWILAGTAIFLSDDN